MKVSLVTLGCRVNQSESDVIKETLEVNGVTIVDISEKPDYCIVNTCTVTQKSDYTSRQIIRKASRTGAHVIVTGCYSQLHEQEVAAMPGVVKLVNIKDKYDIVSMITQAEPKLSFAVSSRSRPFLKVQDGCNFNCSYCTVPIARGRSRSVPLNLLVERVREVTEKGFSEVVLTGIHLGTYGKDLPGQTTVSGLVKTLLTQTQIHRMRLSSLEINEIDDELLEVMQDSRICRNLHIPLQSGSDKLLGLMRRSYNSGYFRKRVELIAKRLGNIGLGTDIIVGFPGESEEDFNETQSLIENLPFNYLHVFPYSPRPNTDASMMAGRPSGQTLRKRTDRLRWLGNEKKRQYMMDHIGKSLEIIMEEGPSVSPVVGTSSNYLKISVPHYDQRRGSIEIAQPVGIKNGILEGLLIKDP